ncbi:ABC transporter permease, partial [Rhizobium ruizarguesonis]
MTTIDDDTLPQASARPKASPQADSGRVAALGAFLRAGAVFILLA